MGFGSKMGRLYEGYIDGGMRDLLQESFDLVEIEKKRVQDGSPKYHDYGFVVFPAAKAYEGFLKKLFLDMGLISKQQYQSDHFRIGRALSPSLPKRYRIGWVYGKLVNYCQGETLPIEMWETWKRARNRVFHFFPQHQECVSLAEAERLISDITQIMDKSLLGCGISH